MVQKQADYVEQIRKAYPEVDPRDCELDVSGQYNDVLFVNRQFVFRFPRFQQGVTDMAVETRLLTWLQDKLPLSVPNPCFQYLEKAVPGKAFMGYAVIPGEALTRERLCALTGQAAWEKMAAQLGNFLRVLHSLDPSGSGNQLPLGDGREYWEMLYAEIRTLLFTAMRPDARRAVSQHFEAYLDAAQSQSFTPSLRHGDFGPGNILYSPGEVAVKGVLDFSFATMGDPAVDLASLSCYGDEFLQAVLAHYPAQEGIVERAQFYRGTFALQEALAGIKLNDRQAYEAGLAMYV